MDAKHTPGPWAIKRGDSVVFILSPSGEIAATSSKRYWERHDDADIANATLMAAAPDLVSPWLAADDKDWDHLFRMLPESGHGQFWRAVFHQHRAAIAKATALSETQN